MADADAYDDSRCDLCGQECGPNTECNALHCTFAHCTDGLYHQECLYQFLKANKLEKNRKTGFKCPRGCGKGTKWPTPCPGRIDKSHPIIPKNEEKSKKRQAAVIEAPPKPPRPDKAAEKAAAKAKAEQERAAAAARAKEEEKAKHKSNGAAAALVNSNKPVPARALAAAMGVKPGKEKKQVVPDIQQLAAAKAQALRDLKGETGAGSSAAPSASKAAAAGSASDRSTGQWAGSAAAAAAAAAHEAALAPPPVTGTSLGDLISLAAMQKAGRGRGSSAGLERSASASGSDGGAASPVPPPTPTPTPVSAGSAPDVQSHHHFPPVAVAAAPAARPTSPATKPSAAGGPAWPTVAAAVAAASPAPAANGPTARLQRQPSEPGTSAAAPASAAATPRPQANGSADDHVANGAATAGAAKAADPPAAPAPAAAAANGDVAEDEDAASKQLSRAQRKNLKRAEKKKRHSSVPELEELDPATLAEPPPPAATTATTQQQQQQQQVQAPAAAPAPLTKAEQRRLQQQQKQLQAAVPEHLLEHAAAPDTPQLQQEPRPLGGAASSNGNGCLPLQDDASSPQLSSNSSSVDTPSTAATEQQQQQEQQYLLQQQQAQAQELPPRVRDTMEDMAITELVTRKCRVLYAQLCRLGFATWQAAAAVRAAGCSAERALGWLLDAGQRGAGPGQLWGTACALPLPLVDISAELAQLSVARSALRLPTEPLLQAVIHSSGDVGVALASVQAQLSSSGGSWRGDALLPPQPSMDPYHPAHSGSLAGLSRAGTCEDDLLLLQPQQGAGHHPALGLLSDGFPLQALASSSTPHPLDSTHTSLSHLGCSSTSLPGLLQTPSSTRQEGHWGGPGGRGCLEPGPQDPLFYLSAGDDVLGGGAGGVLGAAWGDASSTYSGVYSRQGVNGSAAGTWESHGSGDVHTPGGGPAGAGGLRQGQGRSPAGGPLAVDAGSDDAELNSLMALCAQ